MEQLSLFPAALRVGAYIEEHGRRLAWDELQVGMTVIYDCSTESHEWLMVTTVEKIIRTPDDLRVILDGGRKQRPLINRCHIESGRTKRDKRWQSRADTYRSWRRSRLFGMRRPGALRCSSART